MEKVKNLNKSGITLIALIITIIVLLILAGITINLTIGQGGIMNIAQQAGKNYIDAAELEKNILADLKIDDYMNKVTGTRGEDLASLTPGTATASDISVGKTAWVNGEQVTGTATMLKPYVFGGIGIANNQISAATSSDENYFTVQSAADQDYLTINVLKNMKIKIILQAVERGGIVDRTIAINNSVVDTVSLYNEKGEYEYNVSSGDVIKITQTASGTALKTVSVLVMCIEEL